MCAIKCFVQENVLARNWHQMREKTFITDQNVDEEGNKLKVGQSWMF
jgi:hypothetical protein